MAGPIKLKVHLLYAANSVGARLAGHSHAATAIGRGSYFCWVQSDRSQRVPEANGGGNTNDWEDAEEL